MRKIILLSDGTGNGAAKKERTNVWRLYNALDLHKSDQVAYYDDGVGSEEFLPLQILGGAFGFGLKRNVLELYKFLCRNYKDGDKIYLLGFSRGAFTVRILAGLIARCGLYTDYTSETDLDERVKNNYSLFRTGFTHRGLSKIYFILNDVHEYKDGTLFPEIEFIGVWDTVDAYGFPVDEITSFWDRFIFPIYFPNQKLSPKVKRANQALCIDDERQTFHPILWDECDESALEAEGKVTANRIEQVWFSGAHSDVGGGYPMNNLALVSLDWMISKIEVSESRTDGLIFISGIRNEIHNQSDWHGIQHNPRSGAGAYYRYKPRMISEFYINKEGNPINKIPKIHFSVLERIKDNVVTYAPLGIPADYEVISTEGMKIDTYESDEQKKKRMALTEEVMDIVNSRVKLYYGLLFTTLILLGSRFFLEWSPTMECEGVGCILKPLSSLLPSFVVDWFDALSQNPLWLFIFGGTFGILFMKKTSWWHETKVKMMQAWKALKM
ncbi:MAG: DUF2235 domain-containing protein [Campylobacterota bacterium]|nr:DUF2235 domain-containing protein [Campylobacterota bacterium]